MPTAFNHERLQVYKLAIQFVETIGKIIYGIPSKYPIKDQLERASVSIPLNIAEGNGRFTPKDRCRFLDTARGSALECAACLDVLQVKGLCSQRECEAAKQELIEIVSMLVGLIRSTSGERSY